MVFGHGYLIIDRMIMSRNRIKQASKKLETKERKPMNKKKLLLVLLTLAIVTSLSAGTLAVYTTQDTWTQGTVQIKKFAFAAAGNSGETTTVKLAPKEKTVYHFTVSNTENSVTAEVPLKYTINVDYSGAKGAMTGLQATLKDDSTTLVDSNTTGSISYASTSSLPADTSTTRNYTLTLYWPDGDNTTQTTEGSDADALGNTTYGMTITVNAEQDTTGL